MKPIITITVSLLLVSSACDAQSPLASISKHYPDGWTELATEIPFSACDNAAKPAPTPTREPQRFLKALHSDEVRSQIKRKRPSMAYLAKLGKDAGLPDNTLQMMWLFESMAGDLNVTHKRSKCSGHFQFSEASQAEFGLKDPFDFKQAAQATVRYLKARSDQAALPITSPSIAYCLLQQGGSGCRRVKEAAQGAPLRSDIVTNINSNIPTMARDAYGAANLAAATPQELAAYHQKVWDSEAVRVVKLLEGGTK